MNPIDDPSTALLTDLYQLTMACGYWRSGVAEREAVFHLHFRKNPFQGGYAIACGLRAAIGWLDRLRFSDGDLAYLRTLQGNDGKALFPADFLASLGQMKFALDVDAAPEGSVRSIRPVLTVSRPNRVTEPFICPALLMLPTRALTEPLSSSTTPDPSVMVSA